MNNKPSSKNFLVLLQFGGCALVWNYTRTNYKCQIRLNAYRLADSREKSVLAQLNLAQSKFILDDDVVTLCGIMMIIRNIILNRKHVQELSKRYYVQNWKTEREKLTGRSFIIWCLWIIWKTSKWGCVERRTKDTPYLNIDTVLAF